MPGQENVRSATQRRGKTEKRAQRTRNALKEAGIKVEMVKEQFTDDVSGYAGKQMTQFVDGMYVEQVRQWTKTKMEAMIKAGYVCGGALWDGKGNCRRCQHGQPQ